MNMTYLASLNQPISYYTDKQIVLFIPYTLKRDISYLQVLWGVVVDTIWVRNAVKIVGIMPVSGIVSVARHA